jgi:hypothetical protein
LPHRFITVVLLPIFLLVVLLVFLLVVLPVLLLVVLLQLLLVISKIGGSLLSPREISGSP